MNRSRTIPAFGLGVFLMRGKDCFSPDGVPPHIHHATYKLFGWMGRSTLNGKPQSHVNDHFRDRLIGGTYHI